MGHAARAVAGGVCRGGGATIGGGIGGDKGAAVCQGERIGEK